MNKPELVPADAGPPPTAAETPALLLLRHLVLPVQAGEAVRA